MYIYIYCVYIYTQYIYTYIYTVYIYMYTIRSFSVAFQNSKTERPKRHPDGSVVWLANLNLDAENSIPCFT